MNDLEKKLISYIKEMNIAKATLSQLKGVEIESMDLQLALEVLGTLIRCLKNLGLV